MLESRSTSNSTSEKDEEELLDNCNMLMLCYQTFAGVRYAKLINKNKYPAKGEDSNIKFSTMALFFPVHKEVIVPGTKFTNAPKQVKMVLDRSSLRQSPFNKN